MIVSLAELLALDPTVHELYDLPVGWHAWRKSKEEPWSRERMIIDQT